MEKEDEEEEGEDNPYDEYSKPDPEVVEQASPKNGTAKSDSENKKLLEDALVDLSSEEPSVPAQQPAKKEETKPKPAAKEEEEEEEEEEESEFVPKVKTMWPPPPPEHKEDKPIVRPTGSSVLRKWPPANAKQEQPPKETKSVTTAAATAKPPTSKFSKKWPPEPTAEEVSIVEKIKTTKPKHLPADEKPREQKVRPPSPPVETKRVVSLRPVKAESSLQKQEGQKTTELSAIKLKRTDGKKVCCFINMVAIQIFSASMYLYCQLTSPLTLSLRFQCRPSYLRLVACCQKTLDI